MLAVRCILYNHTPGLAVQYVSAISIVATRGTGFEDIVVRAAPSQPPDLVVAGCHRARGVCAGPSESRAAISRIPRRHGVIPVTASLASEITARRHSLGI